jgi:hypothetical protein
MGVVALKNGPTIALEAMLDLASLARPGHGEEGSCTVCVQNSRLNKTKHWEYAGTFEELHGLPRLFPQDALKFYIDGSRKNGLVAIGIYSSSLGPEYAGT